jgi:hypothetical protein
MIVNLDLSGSPVVTAFMLSDARFRTIVGPFGSGKSSGAVNEIVRRAKMQAKGRDGFRRSRWAVVRNTMPMLRDTTMKTWFDWFPDGSCGWWKETGKTFFLEFGDVKAEVMFRALDDAADVKNLLSLELTGAYINESREIPREIVEGLRGRVNRYPAMKDGGCTWYGIWADTNPPEEGTYWWALMEGLDPETGEPRPTDMKTFKQPGGMIRVAEGEPYHVKMRNGWKLRLNPLADNAKNLPPQYYLDLCADASDEYIKVYVLGMYGTSKAGKPVHPLFDPDFHVAKNALLPNKHLPLLIAADFGLTPAMVLKQQDPHGRVLTLDEVVTEKGQSGLSRAIEEKLKPLLLRKYPGFNIQVTGDPAGGQGSQNDERSCVDIFKQHGFRQVRFAYSNSPVHRTNATDHFLARRIEQRAAYLVSPQCSYLIRGMKGGYHYKISKAGIVSDEVEKNIFSHVSEAGQYGDMWYFKGQGFMAGRSDREDWLRQLAAQSRAGAYSRRS